MSGNIFGSFFCLTFLIGSISALHPRIIGGRNTVIKKFPYLVSIRIKGMHLCGGSIISDRHILTAAHCLQDFSDLDKLSSEITVHSGTSNTFEEGTVHKVLATHSHPEYDRYDKNTFNDIAVITLNEPIIFNKYQQKIKLPSHDVKHNVVAYVVGWGMMSKWDNNLKVQLQKLRVVILPFDKCQQYVSEFRKQQLCSFRNVGMGTYFGDSGGPLVANGEIVGIVSYGEKNKCAAENPDFYTNVFAYNDFIESVMAKSL